MSSTLRDLMGAYADEAERCIRCGFCNSVCPTTLSSIGHIPSRTSRGRLVLLQSSLNNGTPHPFTPRFKELIDLCIGCLRCLNVCPARIPIPTVMSSYRRAYIIAVGEKMLSRGERMVAHYEPIVKYLSRAPAPLRKILLGKPLLQLFRRIGEFADDAPLPIPEGGALDKYFKKNAPRPGHRTLAYFSDTYARFVKPSVGISARELLRTAGIELTYPRQYDSGVILWELGFWERVAKLAARNVDSLFEEVEKGRRILCTSPASTLMLREVYPKLLDNEKSRTVSEAVVDINELINGLVESGRLSANLSGFSPILHSTCLSQHLNLTGQIAEAFEKLGAHIEGVVTECCGSGGLWGLFRKNRKLSTEIGGILLKRLGPGDTVLSYSETCAQQVISLTHGKKAVHLPHEALYNWVKRAITQYQAVHISQAS
ncbi:Anaerobic glycerol-3-phosphate dehydrogenase subunit C [Candidatus Calditenuaceae archaeon HR02]|nr:Anaerobic glycerol-3-phosphate dehydrogenase subunit C [Candidatus Calditenuaceae archaeon HR02]